MQESEPLTTNDLSLIEESLCRERFEWLLSRHYVIHNKQGLIQLLSPLRMAQRKALALVKHLREQNQPVRIIIGKSRKQGLSTIIEADLLNEVINKDINAMVIAHDKELSEKLLDITQRYYRYLDAQMVTTIPPISKPPLYKGVSSKNEIRFEEREGRIWIGTANNVYAGTGLTPQYLHCSEMSKWEKGSATAISLFQSVAAMPNTTIVIESTFNGHDALFLPYWEGSYENCKLEWKYDDTGAPIPEVSVTNPDRWNYFVPMFISVLDDEDARLDFKTDADRAHFLQTLDKYESSLMDKMSATPEFLNWRRMALRMMCQNKIDVLRQEYPTTPEEAVQATGRHRFNQQMIDLMWLNEREDGERGTLCYSERWDRKIKWSRDSGGEVIKFKDPVPNHRYVIGCDTAEGKLDEHGNERDATVCTIHDMDMGMEQAAILYGPISEENIVTPLVILGEYYNDAFIVVESNSTGKHTAIQLGKKYPRERLYHRDDFDERSRSVREIGWRTTVGNKSILVGSLAEAIEDRAIHVHCEQSIKELRYYVHKPGGGTEAEPGYHDDHVMALGLAVMGARSRPVLLDRSRVERFDDVEKLYQKPMKTVRRDGVDSITGY